MIDKWLIGILFLLSITFSTAQDFEIEKFQLGDLLDFPSSISFAEQGDSVVWLHYKTTSGGSSVDRLLNLKNGEWSAVAFEICTSCIRDFKTGPDGNVFIAATDQGIYKRSGAIWEQVLDIEARGIEWTADGRMVIINSEGLHFYNGDSISSANNNHLPPIINLNDLEVDLSDDVYMVLPSKLFMNKDTGWVQLTELTAPMSIEVDSENQLWVTDNFGEIGYYQEGIYAGQQYDRFGTNDLAINQNDVLWYSSTSLIRNENGNEQEIEAEDLIDDALFIESIYVDRKNRIWVASNFKSDVARVRYLGEFSDVENILEASDINVIPNPVSTNAVIEFDLKTAMKVGVYVHDSTGKLLGQFGRHCEAGANNISLDMNDYESGIYFVELTLGRENTVLKVIKK